MIPELGQYALALALVVAIVQGLIPLAGAQLGRVEWMRVGRPAAQLQFALLFFSLGCLTWGFLHHDFTVQYIALNSNSQLPWYYRITAVWSSHEGSFLLWSTFLAAWSLAVAQRSHSLPLTTAARVLSVMGVISVGFVAFLLFVSNPFTRTLPLFPVDGRDMNPLLQDFGMIVHPPMLYMGYVGFSVAFAFAIAALLGKNLDSAWARWARPWTIAAWIFLTLGIMLGSWWAYYELGWGGWWFWDPVENASFMPWLAGTALMHSLAVTEKRGGFKAWTVLLALTTFSLSLLGAFLVRSGVLTSVHAFATDPERGMFILTFLVIVIGGSLLLFAVRGQTVRSQVPYHWCSRELALLANNVLLAILTLTVLIGTLQPLIVDALALGKISVGPPYFNFMFSLFATPLIFLIGIGPQIRWRQDAPGVIVKRLWPLLLLSLVIGVALPMLFDIARMVTIMAVALAIWIVLPLARDLLLRARQGQMPARAWWGMAIAHAGVGVTLIGVVISSYYSVERDVRLATGKTAEVGPYQVTMTRMREIEGPNYGATRAWFEIREQGEVVASLHPEKRTYNASRQTMTEAAIDPGLTRDLYIAMGEPLGDGSWAVRVYYKPYVRWIWLGALLMALGGMLAASDPRYRRQAARDAKQKSATAAPANATLTPTVNEATT